MRVRVQILIFVLASGAIGQVKHESIVTVDDGIGLNTSVFLPDGPPPQQGWPAIVFVHGLSGSKPEAAASRAARRGYVGLAYTVRGQGRRQGGSPSGGFATPVGEREARDACTRKASSPNRNASS